MRLKQSDRSLPHWITGPSVRETAVSYTHLQKEYSLLLTDLNMPDINGFELLELLRSSNVGNSPTIPVVVATASDVYKRQEQHLLGFQREVSYLVQKQRAAFRLMEISFLGIVRTCK